MRVSLESHAVEFCINNEIIHEFPLKIHNGISVWMWMVMAVVGGGVDVADGIANNWLNDTKATSELLSE